MGATNEKENGILEKKYLESKKKEDDKRRALNRLVNSNSPVNQVASNDKNQIQNVKENAHPRSTINSSYSSNILNTDRRSNNDTFNQKTSNDKQSNQTITSNAPVRSVLNSSIEYNNKPAIYQTASNLNSENAATNFSTTNDSRTRTRELDEFLNQRAISQKSQAKAFNTTEGFKNFGMNQNTSSEKVHIQRIIDNTASRIISTDRRSNNDTFNQKTSNDKQSSQAITSNAPVRSVLNSSIEFNNTPAVHQRASNLNSENAASNFITTIGSNTTREFDKYELSREIDQKVSNLNPPSHGVFDNGSKVKSNNSIQQNRENNRNRRNRRNNKNNSNDLNNQNGQNNKSDRNSNQQKDNHNLNSGRGLETNNKRGNRQDNNRRNENKTQNMRDGNFKNTPGLRQEYNRKSENNMSNVEVAGSNNHHYNNKENKKGYRQAQRERLGDSLNKNNRNFEESKTVTIASASANIQKFWNELSKRVLNFSNTQKRFELHTDEHKLWLETWKAAACGASGPIKILPIAYLKLPATTQISPSPIVTLQTLIQVVKKLNNENSASKDIPVINVLEAVFDTINLRLPNSIQNCSEPCTESVLKFTNELESVLFPTITKSMMQYPDESERFARLILRRTEINEFKKKIQNLVMVSQQLLDENTQDIKHKCSWLGWQQNPTLNWLMSGSWHHVDGLKATYSSSDEYAESLLKLWTLLTFYWGSGAVWPRCAYKQNEKNSATGSDNNACGEPLLAPATSGVCRKNGCGGEAAWKCYRHNHDFICKRCLLRQQENLIGSPGVHASTDIYDAVVERETIRREETVYLMKNLESRKPPKIAPNWKTTYRLPVSVLVAVIKLSASHEPIPRNSIVQWGEIVPVDIKAGANQDYTFRSKGRIAIRLLSRADCVGMPEDTEIHIDRGTRVVIIDLRVFVPEVISVLNTFSKEDFKDQLNQIPFINRLIGHDSVQKTLEYNKNDSIYECVRHALENSEIDYIQRLNQYSKSQLIGEICSLKPIQTLSGTQLEAFAAALFSAVHCTQGPPGTGKSYIGVCLVLALDIIRKIAQSTGHAVGPVLVLSYKNHALDEFLLDVIHQYEASSLNISYKQPFNRHLRPGMLIRTGKPDIESLQMFTERFSPLEREAQDRLSYIIIVQRKVKNIIKMWLECARNLEISSFNDEELDWTPLLDNLNAKFPEFYCYSSGAICCALVFFCNVNQFCQNTFSNNDIDQIEIEDSFKLLEFNAQNPFLTDLEKSKLLLLDMISSLSKGVEHWKDPQNQPSTVYFIINWWLKGNKPPPRCQALVNGSLCLEEAENSPYCDALHSCKMKLCSNERLNSKVLFCADHSCLYPNRRNKKPCKTERFQNSEFCAKHICVGCLLNKSELIKSRLPFACKDHECIEDNCNKLQIFPHKFCADHLCKECAAKNDVKNLSIKSESSSLCEYHKCRVLNCDLKCYDDKEFCSYHFCRLCYKNKILNGVDLSCPKSQLCIEHRCSHSKLCLNLKVDKSSCCLAHSCKECITLKCDKINQAADKPPRNSCFNHPLCQFINDRGKLCNNIALKSNLYCAGHQERRIQVPKDTNQSQSTNGKNNNSCFGLTTKKIKCKSKQTFKIGNEWYCVQHKNQASDLTLNVEVSDSSGDDDEEEGEKNIDNIKLDPVISFVEESIEQFTKIRCNGKFENDENCNVITYCNNKTIWMCPIHDEIRKDQEQKILESKKSTKSVNEPVKIANKDVDSKIKNAILDSKKSSVDEDILLKENKNIQKEQISDHELDDEELNYDEAVATNTHPDEIDDFFEDLDGINEELKRLQELTEIANNSDEGEEDFEEETKNDDISNSNKDLDEDTSKIIPIIANWSWDLNRSERLVAAAKFLRLSCVVFKKLNKKAEKYLVAARKYRAEAGAQAFRNARIVGATVVGASRRLEAIRAAEPFAVVVEEACEVIEPTLMSVLAVNTLKKLELIGDHRQLPAFVQQCWFNFETTMPSIKTSLFERLISGKVKLKSNSREDNRNQAVSVLPYTILDEQRRMRSSIADITRPDYRDVVNIIDHKHTGIQCIGDVVIKNCADKIQVNRTKLHRDLWPAKGRNVPGVCKNIFFWDLPNNSESRPIAGLSACNVMEAEAVASLTKWLLLCGCPPAAISIITPYKGQKTAITNALRKKNCLPPFRKDNPPERGTTLTVSTVDRYQGDENDIIILSLVRCMPGNRFVGLQNRFVVAVSRARLGFFIVGAVKAVTTNRNGSEGPLHWRRFIESLQQQDNNNKTRCGNGFLICCPRHDQQVNLNIFKSSDFPEETKWNDFCRLPCQTILERCGHLCNLPCHSPVNSVHNNKCIEILERPCKIHAEIPLLCHEVNISDNENLQEALERFECNVEVDYCRPECHHVIKIKCYAKSLVLSNRKILNACDVIVSDYIHPICNHIFPQPKCAKKREYENLPPKCTIKVNHRRPCGCLTQMECHERNEELITPSLCKSSVEIPRPRCGHMLSLRCFEGENLKATWNEERGKSAAVDDHGKSEVVVLYGEKYGPSESSLNSRVRNCLVGLNYVAPCGHKMSNIPCDTAFEYASGLKPSPECNSLTSFSCPICQSQVKSYCWLAQILSSWHVWKDETVKNNTGSICISEAILKEAYIPNFSSKIEKIISKLCQAKVNVFRICSPDHITSISCNNLLSILMRQNLLKPCDVKVERILPCKHALEVVCNTKNTNPPPICMEKVNDIYTYPCGIHSISPGVCSKLTTLQSSENPRCNKQITCSRFRCGHSISIPCYLKKAAEDFMPGSVLTRNTNSTPNQSIVESNIQYCEAERELKDCRELVSYRYLCGHIKTDVPCCIAFSWAANNELELPCDQVTPFKNLICGHQGMAPCFEIELLVSWNPWINQKKPIIKEYVQKHNEDKEAILGYVMTENLSMKLEKPPKGVTFSSLICKVPLEVNRECGHTLLTTCSEAYWHSYPACTEPVLIECTQVDCKNVQSLACHIHASEKRTGKSYVCKNKVSRLCTKCNINQVLTECFQVTVECNTEAKTILTCGHEITWICGAEDDPRQNLLMCQPCIYPDWENLINNEVSIENNEKLIGQFYEKIEKIFDDYLSEDKSLKKIPLPDMTDHIKCRKQIISAFYENAKNNGEKINLPPTDSLADSCLYEIVFSEVPEHFKEGEYFKPDNTIYGRGCELIQLNRPGLNNCQIDEDGFSSILVGIAYRYKILPFCPPFCASLNKKGVKAANKLSMSQKQIGFSCVAVSPNESEIKKFVYWEPGSCIPLVLVRYKASEICKICFDYFAGDKGYSCSKKHFLCWDCFEQHVRQASGPDSVGKCMDDAGNFLCVECNETITLRNVAKETAPRAAVVFDLMEKLKADIKIKKTVEKELQEQEARMKKEFERILAIQDADERDAERLRLDIINNILTLRCPRCKIAFIDYSGCAALTCSSCQAGFCAICLMDCGADAHGHVVQCPENRARQMYMSLNEFNVHHSKRREQLVKIKINGINNKVKDLLLKKMRKDFQDLGIHI